MYVIKRIPDGAYVAPSGSHSSYTRDIRRARTFSSREATERECCSENERIVHIWDDLPKPTDY